MSSQRPQVRVELRPSAEGCFVKTRFEGATDRLPRVFVDVLACDEAVAEATGWVLGRLRRLREVRQ